MTPIGSAAPASASPMTRIHEAIAARLAEARGVDAGSAAEPARAASAARAPEPPEARVSPPDAAARRLAGDGAGRDPAEPAVRANAQETQAAEPETDAQGLTPEEQKVVRELRARDAEVKAHEQAHATVGGQYAGAPSYTYQTGPDGRRYAVGGSVPIDVSPEPEPEATIAKMRVVKAAALAPAEPSSADRRVAALADRQAVTARAELAKDQAAELAEATGASADEASDKADLNARRVQDAMAGYDHARGVTEARPADPTAPPMRAAA